VFKPKMIILALIAQLALPASAALAADTATLLQQAEAAWAAQDLKLAETRFREATTQDNDSAEAWAGLAKVLMLENQNTQAIDAYQSAIMASPEDPSLFLGISIAYLHGGEYDAANAMVAQALSLDPSLENAKKLSQYIERKEQQLAETEQQAAALPAGHPQPGAHPPVK